MDELRGESDQTDFAMPAATGAAFLNLAQRAEAFISAQGGQASEDLLVSHVFGSTGSLALWRPLLREVLGQHDRLKFRGDGAWLLADALSQAGTGPLHDFVVLDVETTGLQPSRQRIIEISVARFSGGAAKSLWESLCNPGRSVPKYIVKLTGIDDDLLEDAPTFDKIAGTINELLADTIIVGHNIEFDLGFLNAELERAGRPPLVNERVDTLALATRLLPGVRKPTLNALAQRLGVSEVPRVRHRAGPDAALTGVVAVALLEHARDAGYQSLDELKSIARPVTRRPRERMARASSVVDRSILASIPRAPGVYLMRDANEHVVYVGKAKNLRERVGTYFSQPLGYTRKMDGLIESLSRIQVEVVGSELEALLLESQLIRRYQPRYNTALRSHEQYPFIRIDVANPWPRVSLAKARKDDGARYFGPFRSATTARKTVDLINRVVPLRTCTRSFRDARSYGSPCLQLDLGRCLGPCVGQANRDQYISLVRTVVDYVDGRDQTLHELLWSGLEEAAAALDFERASRLRRDLQASLALTASQRRLRESTEANWVLLVTAAAEPEHRELMLILRGRLWSQLRVADSSQPAVLAARLERCWERFRHVGIGEPDHDSVDDMHILDSWLARHEGHPAILVIQERTETPDWQDLGKRALSLRQDQLDYEGWRKARDAGEAEWGEMDATASLSVAADA
ncbi:MAG: polymerase epsilon subunit [Thermomicrobiales bacterium]|jgi:DNA polymerase III epsilon subunit family exonuclease|nr:polymerase epsilon subunit [Thermomicrobiales bacterium]